MERPACKTYFCLVFDFDVKKNAASLKARRDCTPEELGIYNKTEVERFIVDRLGVVPEWRRHRFILGCNENYDVDVNVMLRATLKDLFGKEDIIKRACEQFGVSAALVIVPYIVADSDEPHQLLSLDRDIIDFMSRSGMAMDLDYYII
ncbi:MAG: DUF4279 domain-containing protein [Clostridiales bacterium]|nr:DUF4279 domain-containing protein [Clostridiales bacterium]